MHDLPPNASTSLLGTNINSNESTPSFNWWRASIVAVVCLAIVSCWLGAERSLVRPAENVTQVEEVKYSPAESRQLAQQYVSSPQSLSDDEYQAAALVAEAQMKRERQIRKTVVYRNFVDPHDRWQSRVNKLQSDLDEIAEFPEGSVQWHMREQLEGLLLEEPKR